MKQTILITALSAAFGLAWTAAGVGVAVALGRLTTRSEEEPLGVDLPDPPELTDREINRGLQAVLSRLEEEANR